uniref:Uncharacterized protein n=1 Tax=viral metagenome TaxID=1070528 RepID=A0A6M3JI10_9ZZZZ
MPSNLPPGCKVSDIPGNSPEDKKYKIATDKLLDELNKNDISPTEFEIAAKIGILSVREMRDRVREQVTKHLLSNNEYIDQLKHEIEVLRDELITKNKTIKELQGEIACLRSRRR